MQRIIPRLPALVSTLALLVVTVPQMIVGRFGDFPTYAAGVERAINTGSPYAPHQLAERFMLPDQDWGVGFVYPPTALPLLAPFPSGVVLDLVGLAALWTVVWMLLRPGWWGVPIALLVGISPPLHNAINEGQVTPLLAAGFGMMYLAPRFSGYFSVINGMVKIAPGFGFVWALRKGEVVGPLVFAAAFSAVVFLWLPRAFPEYLAVLRNMDPGCRAAFPSLACAGFSWAGWVLAGLLALTAWRIRDDRLAFAVLGVATVPAVPDPYDATFLIPMVAVLPLVRMTALWLRAASYRVGHGRRIRRADL